MLSPISVTQLCSFVAVRVGQGGIENKQL